jgi:hypothetical protein
MGKLTDMALPSSTPQQLSLGVLKEIEVDGVAMGVLTDGTPYLTGRGLARMCGIDNSAITRIQSGWNLPELRPREAKIKENLRQQGIVLDQPYIKIEIGGTTTYAYPDTVCMAVLEYYAFEGAAPEARDHALKNYRLLARRSFRDFIYTQVGYSPTVEIPAVWQQFHDRVSLMFDSVPAGYFSVFKEIADIIVTLIRSGARIGKEFIPDISVGQHWGTYWRDNGCEERLGARRRYNHNYPDYFPQSASNPQPAYCYPDAALGEFRKWVREVYLPEKLPAYLGSKTKQGALPPSVAEMAQRAVADRGKGGALS